MIGQLRGHLLWKQPPWVAVDVNGVGYEVEVPMSTFYSLPAVGEPLTLITHLAVRDDAHLLFGFASQSERQLFRDLIKVNGVGARLALTILSGTSVDDFINTVREGDSTRLTRLPGVGKKIAERLVVEMRDRLGDGASASAAGLPGASAMSGGLGPEGEAREALVALGYKPQEAEKLLRGVSEPGLNSEELIRRALRAAVK